MGYIKMLYLKDYPKKIHYRNGEYIVFIPKSIIKHLKLDKNDFIVFTLIEDCETVLLDRYNLSTNELKNLIEKIGDKRLV